jgi:hypothetical protein
MNRGCSPVQPSITVPLAAPQGKAIGADRDREPGIVGRILAERQRTIDLIA